MKKRIGGFLAGTLLTVQACTMHSAGAPDSLTVERNGRIWQRQDDGVGRNWEDALLYCESLTLAGYMDWRLPHIKELESLTDDRLHTPAIDVVAFPNAKNAGYWSSTSLVENPSFAWFVYFNNGYVNPVDKSHEYYTRCVRSGRTSRNPAQIP
jgi:hypothetical protein